MYTYFNINKVVVKMKKRSSVEMDTGEIYL
jgi:hypothetical protein